MCLRLHWGRACVEQLRKYTVFMKIWMPPPSVMFNGGKSVWNCLTNINRFSECSTKIYNQETLKHSNFNPSPSKEKLKLKRHCC